MLLGLLVLLVAGSALYKDIKKETRLLISRTNLSNTFTSGISSSFQCSMGEGAFVHLEFLGVNCLVGSSG